MWLLAPAFAADVPVPAASCDRPLCALHLLHEVEGTLAAESTPIPGGPPLGLWPTDRSGDRIAVSAAPGVTVRAEIRARTSMVVGDEADDYWLGPWHGYGPWVPLPQTGGAWTWALPDVPRPAAFPASTPEERLSAATAAPELQGAQREEALALLPGCTTPDTRPCRVVTDRYEVRLTAIRGGEEIAVEIVTIGVPFNC